MAGQTSRANGQKGGRPKGKKSAATLEREAVAAAFRQRVLKAADRLFDAQLALASGCSFLYRIERTKSKKQEKARHVLVTDAEEIQRYLDGELDSEDYYYVTTKEPNNQAIVDMLNRAIGKPKDEIEHSGAITVTAMSDEEIDRRLRELAGGKA
jgi:hypothetical protein